MHVDEIFHVAHSDRVTMAEFGRHGLLNSDYSMIFCQRSIENTPANFSLHHYRFFLKLPHQGMTLYTYVYIGLISLK